MLKKIFIVGILFALVTPFYNARAQEGAQGLTISPPISEIDLTPGKVYDGIIKVNNPTKEVVEVYPIARNFSASGETGVPTIESPGEDATYGLASWISFSQSKIALTPEQDIEFKYRITVPTDAEPGGHYGSVLFASQPPKPDEKATQVALASMIGSLILAKVPGNIIEKADVKEFTTNRWLYFKPPVNFTLRITNSGNIHFKPQGEIVISNWGKKKGTLDINSKKGNILPNTTRKFENLTYSQSKWAFGKFTAKLSSTYGENNQPLTDQITFWIIPWWLIVIKVIILATIIWLIIRKIKKNRRKKKSSQKSEPPQRKRVILQ
ncbi:hypothetical protein A2V71_01390 [Candidatus Berkelbacteria bacterium RBG_13_40_8]|uniref:DUF916 domain-containing protein n=1 Tax=Candidatus Berkelbacteria bacterium RBG_13_40_8 TaxID=1797467 RepID=A0A1F5DMU2_9BACT|nr:MAG: hypothetical protein A2V71_01390 [Candidatus Berkelbacteria bacterium RBG_13_40_8]